MRSLFLTALLSMVLVGCVTKPPKRIEEIPLTVPDSWTIQSDHYQEGVEVDGWLSDVGDEILIGYVKEALENSFSFQAALARLDRAQADAGISGADKWPSITAGFRASRNRRNSSGGLQITGNTSNTFSPSLSVSWELDIWGRVRDSYGATLAEWQAAQEVYEGARLSLAANIARSWIDVIEARLQMELSEKTLESFEKNFVVVEENFKRGIASALEFQLAKSNVASTRSDLERRRRIADNTVRNFQAIIGRYPDGGLEVSKSLPTLENHVPVGLPSELLNRRPDIVEAERRLAANSKRVSASEKSLLPAIRLTGSAGIQTGELSEVANSDFKVWNLVANLTQPLFDGRRLKAGVERAQANYDEALADYGLTILTAFREVETLLAADRFYESERVAREIAAAESAMAEEMAWEEYSRGLIDITTVLEAQRRAFNSKSTLLNVTSQRLNTRISLYLALGGDFFAARERQSDFTN
jgi:multidrug efflux system outer membrane protein